MESLLDRARSELQLRCGVIDLQSAVFPFDYTTYYEEELGKGLLRQFASFDRLIDPGELRAIKRETIRLETEMSVGEKRTVNVDPGYVNLSTVVLATTKDASYRVYLGDGIYGQATLSYRAGAFAPFEWTYPDYREAESLRFFGEVRKRFKEQLREDVAG